MESRTAANSCGTWCLLYQARVPSGQINVDFINRTSGDSPVDQRAQAAKLYFPIKEWQARILRLQPGTLRRELIADLVTVDIILADGVVSHEEQERITYDALSYCWGEPIFDRDITINNIRYPITKNLYVALQRIRRDGEPRYLWIDALCINQFDVAERSMQVRGMLNIYKKAATVLVWLGECDRDTAFCLQYIVGLRSRSATKVNLFVSDCCDYHDDVVYNGLRKLLDRPWYGRVWIRQEIWAAKEITVLCGGHSLRWEWMPWVSRIPSTFTRKTRRYSPLLDEGQTGLRGLRQAQSLELASVEHRELVKLFREQLGLPDTQVDLFNVIRSSTRCQCTDNRDRIYGVLGMTIVETQDRSNNLHKPHTLTIDYTRSTARVFYDAARYIMLSDRSCLLLGMEGSFGGLIEGKQLPSWCPDWSKPFAEGANRQLDISDETRDKVNISFERGVLFVSAYVIGTVFFTYPRNLGFGSSKMRVIITEPRNDSKSEVEIIGSPEPEDTVVSTALGFEYFILRKVDGNRATFQGWVVNAGRLSASSGERRKEFRII